MILHTVLIRWKANSGDQRRLAIASIANIASFDGVLSLVHGRNVSLETVGRAFDYAFVVPFVSAPALAAYLDNPVHQPISDAITAAAERVVVAYLNNLMPGSLPVEVLVSLDWLGNELVLVPIDSPTVAHRIPLGTLRGFPITLATVGDIALVGLSNTSALKVDLGARQVVQTINLTVPPQALAIGPDGYAYAGSRDYDQINRIDLSTGIASVVGVQGGTSAFGFARGKVFAVVANRKGCEAEPDACSEGASWLTTIIPTSLDSVGLSGPGNASAAVTAPDGYLYVVSSGEGGPETGRLSVVDPLAGAETSSFGSLGPSPRLLVSDGGERVLIASDVGGLMIFNTRMQRMTLPFGSGVPLSFPVTMLTDAAGRTYVIERGGCTEASPGRARVFGSDLVERPPLQVGSCPVAASIAEIPAEQIFEEP